MSKIKINGVEIEYEVWGDGPETVVMLHSMGLCRGGMEPLAERLRDQYRVLLWDYRGMGGSEKPITEAIGTETLYEDSVAFINELSDKPVHLIGMSMGGWIGLRIAARQPHIVRSLTVMASSAEGADTQGAEFFKIIKKKGFSDPEIVKASMAVSFSPTVLQDPDRAEDMKHWESVMRDLDPRTMAVTHSLTTRLSIQHEIKSITAPTLVIAGEHDRNHSPDEMIEIHRSISGSHFTVIKNCGHTPIVERPDDVTTTVQPFLDQN